MKLFYRQYGKGPPLVILHGLYGSSDNWVTIAKSLSDTYTVYLPDQRNHGHSPHHKIHDYDSMRDDLFELANDLKLDKLFLAGHSMGGKTAISFALKWPEMINGLLIADISPFKNENTNQSAYDQHLTILKAMLSIDLSQIETREKAESILSEEIISDRTRGFILKNLQRTSDNKFVWKINARSLFDNLEKIMGEACHLRDVSTEITGFPVIFLKGENSDYLPVGDFRSILKVFPAAELTIVPNAGHWLHTDNPTAVTDALRTMLLV